MKEKRTRLTVINSIGQRQSELSDHVDASHKSEPKQREYIQCHDMKMITKITQMLDLINRSGYDIKSVNVDSNTVMENTDGKISGQSITQLQPFNRNELIYKTMKLFEPAETFETNSVQKDPSL